VALPPQAWLHCTTYLGWLTTTCATTSYSITGISLGRAVADRLCPLPFTYTALLLLMDGRQDSTRLGRRTFGRACYLPRAHCATPSAPAAPQHRVARRHTRWDRHHHRACRRAAWMGWTPLAYGAAAAPSRRPSTMPLLPPSQPPIMQPTYSVQSCDMPPVMSSVGQGWEGEDCHHTEHGCTLMAARTQAPAAGWHLIGGPLLFCFPCRWGRRRRRRKREGGGGGGGGGAAWRILHRHSTCFDYEHRCALASNAIHRQHGKYRAATYQRAHLTSLLS